MKTLQLRTAILMVVMTFFFGINSIQAGNTPTDVLRSSLMSQITYPVQAKENHISGDVEIIFGLNDQGELTIYSTKSNEAILETHVRESFSKLDFSTIKMEKGIRYRIVITFNLL